MRPAPPHPPPFYSPDTIVAVATPPGRGGIGIVRLSGPLARAIADPLLRLRHPLVPTRARFGHLVDPADGRILDEVVATFFAAPHSYTSEDVVEIATHGAPILLDHLVRQCCQRGARLAEPGEFTRRAFLAGRIDLTQAEAVAGLIAASTLQQARVAARQIGGALAAAVAPAKSALLHLIAALEAGIDFAEDDIDVLPAASIAAQLDAIHAPLAALEATFRYGRIVRDGLRLALVGRPNAGKSSLFNRLAQADRAIVTPVPGTTRDTVTHTVAIAGIPVELIDTAGLRHASDEAERLGIARSRQAIAEADLVLLVVDSTAGLHHEDRAIVQQVVRQQAGAPMLLAWNKCDLSPVHPPEPPAGVRLVPTSALTGHGVEKLRQAIVHSIAGETAPQREAAMLTTLRQHQAVAQSLAALAAARAALTARVPHEMLLFDLYAALRGLDSLTGATTTDDILGLIFSSFCIGK